MNLRTSLHTLTLSRLALVLLLVVSQSYAQWDDTNPFAMASGVQNQRVNKQCLASDLVDNLHALYVQQGPGLAWNIKYRQRSSEGTWSNAEFVNTDPDTASEFTPCIAVSPNLDPAVAFVYLNRVYVALHDGTVFEVQEVSDGTADVYTPSVGFGNNDWLNLVWTQEDGPNNYQLVYAYGDGFADWTFSTLPVDLGPFGSGASPRIKVDSEGAAHIIFRGGVYPDYELKHAYNALPGDLDWTVETVPAPTAADYGGDLEFDHNGDLHAVTFGNDGFGFPGQVYYTTREPGGEWSDPLLASIGYSAIEPEMSIDYSDSPHMIWSETSGNFYTGNIYYTYFSEETGWESSLLTGDDYYGTAFVRTHDGYGHLLYGTGANTGLEDVLFLSSIEPLGLTQTGPVLTLSPPSLEFGEIEVGDNSVRLLTLTNTGTEDLEMTTFAVSNGFTGNVTTPATIESNSQLTAAITFTPTTAEDYEGQITILTNAPSSPDHVPLYGAGVVIAPIVRFEPEELDFGTVFIGRDSTIAMAINNDGAAALQILDAATSEGYAQVLDAPITIEPGLLIEVPITFTPTLPQQYDGYFVLFSDAASSPDTVSLSGIGEDESSSENPGSGIPGSCYLSQNYPNPFNSTTSIGFGISTGGYVRLDVRDILGREISTLIDGVVEAGDYRVSWDCAECATGLYFIELNASNEYLVRKAIYMK